MRVPSLESLFCRFFSPFFLPLSLLYSFDWQRDVCIASLTRVGVGDTRWHGGTLPGLTRREILSHFWISFHNGVLSFHFDEIIKSLGMSLTSILQLVSCDDFCLKFLFCWLKLEKKLKNSPDLKINDKAYKMLSNEFPVHFDQKMLFFFFHPQSNNTDAHNKSTLSFFFFNGILVVHLQILINRWRSCLHLTFI